MHRVCRSFALFALLFVAASTSEARAARPAAPDVANLVAPAPLPVLNRDFVEYGCESYRDSTGWHSRWWIKINWPWTSTSSVGHVQGGVEVAPLAGASVPTVARLLNFDDSPALDAMGQPIVMSVAPPDAIEAEQLYGLLSPDHAWSAFRAGALLPEPPSGQDRQFKLQFEMDGDIQPHGAMWVSDDLSETGGTSDQADVYVTFGQPTPVRETSWGAIKAQFRR